MTRRSARKWLGLTMVALSICYQNQAFADGEAFDNTPIGTYCGINEPRACITFSSDRSISLNFAIGNNLASAPLQVSSGLRGDPSGTQFTFLAYVDFPQGFPDHGTYCRYNTRIVIDVQSSTEIDYTFTGPSQIKLVDGACTFIGRFTGVEGLRK